MGTMELNKIYNTDFLNNTIPDKSIQLIIADPPYFEVKGEFDFVWKSFDDYLKDVEKWAIECKRILADNGSLFWWGHSKKIAYTQIILDKYFKLENSLVWQKTDSVQYQYYSVDLSRSFNTHNERLLFYSNEVLMTGLEKIKLDIKNFTPLRDYFKKIYEKINKKKSDIIKQIGQSADHCFRFDSTQWHLPTVECYEKIISLYKIDKFKFFKEYEDLRKEYEDLRRPFNNIKKIEDVLKYSQESSNTKKYNHPTQKPEKLTSDLIMVTTRENDTVCVPFAGSGTECAMSIKHKRNFIGFDIDPNHVETATNRTKYYINNPTLF